MSLKDNIVDKIIKPHSDNRFDNVIAKIVSFDKITNSASIMFKNPKNVGMMKLDNVPVCYNNGFVNSNLKSGDSVYVIFINGSILHPYISQTVKTTYVNDTRIKQRHKRKGAYIIDREYNDVEIKKYNDIPNIETWIDSSNENINKYNLHSQSEPIHENITNFNEIGFFKEDEVGMYHPELSSVIKLRNNGIIDIFTMSNQGIRINPNEKTIKLLSDNLNFTSNKWYIESDEFVFNGKKFSINADEIDLISKSLNIDNVKQEE